MVNPGVDGYTVLKSQINGKYSEKTKRRHRAKYPLKGY